MNFILIGPAGPASELRERDYNVIRVDDEACIGAILAGPPPLPIYRYETSPEGPVLTLLTAS